MPNPAPSFAPASATSRSADAVAFYLAGVGSVGRALVEQIEARSSGGGPRLLLVGACRSRHAIWQAEGLALGTAAGHLENAPPPDWPQILERLENGPRPLVFVDATGSVEVARRYERILRAGVHVVTPSKHANTQSQGYFDRLLAAAREAGVAYRYETTAGAALPVVQAVQDLSATGDPIREIRGAASGTLTFVFDALRQGTPFSEAVREASRRGYAEPDVRDDLSGEDVARKFLILARTAGFRIERQEVEVESLVPEALRAAENGTVVDRLAEWDARWAERVRRAEAEGAVLQYAGRLAEGRITIGVEAVGKGTPLGRLRGTDNLFQITTDRYAPSALVIQGPGAGPSVTAGGVLADLLKAAALAAARAPA